MIAVNLPDLQHEFEVWCGHAKVSANHDGILWRAWLDGYGTGWRAGAMRVANDQDDPQDCVGYCNQCPMDGGCDECAVDDPSQYCNQCPIDDCGGPK